MDSSESEVEHKPFLRFAFTGILFLDLYSSSDHARVQRSIIPSALGGCWDVWMVMIRSEFAVTVLYAVVADGFSVDSLGNTVQRSRDVVVVVV